jgi:hypothetical protein
MKSRVAIVGAGAAFIAGTAALYYRSPEKKQRKPLDSSPEDEMTIPKETEDESTTKAEPSSKSSSEEETSVPEETKDEPIKKIEPPSPAGSFSPFPVSTNASSSSTSTAKDEPIKKIEPPSPSGSFSPFPVSTNASSSSTSTANTTTDTPIFTNTKEEIKVGKLGPTRPYFAPQVIFAFLVGFVVMYKVLQIRRPTEEEMRSLIFRFFLCLICVWCLDMFFKYVLKSKANWKLLHCCANFGVVAGSLEDVIFAFKDPHMTCVVKASPIPCTIIGALHLYHLMAYSTSSADWFHHVLFCGTLVPIGLLDPNPIVNIFSFFLSGLPGGIDYLMLSLVKHNKMSREVEKVWNARINVWLRSPGCMAAAGVMYAAIKYGPDSTCSQNPEMGVILGGLIIFNGQYYQQVVVGNTYRKVQHYSS